MACKCVLIDKLEHDIRWLRVAEDHARTLLEHAQAVNPQLTDLAKMYSATVNAQPDLISGFAKVDENAISNAKIVYTKVMEAQEKAMQKYEKAVVEDDKYHGRKTKSSRLEVLDNVRLSNIM